MPPRTILYTGKGGVGKTSVAAATALRCAAAGRRTVVLSTDPAHSLADALQVELGPDPRPVTEGLWGQEVSAQDELERNWAAVRAWLGAVLVERGVDRVSAQELTAPPRHERVVQPPAAQTPPRRGRVRGRRRRLRADRRDAAAVVLPRCRAMVAGQGVPAAQRTDGRRAAD